MLFSLLLPDISNYSCLGIFFQSTEFKGDRNLTFRPSSLGEIAYLRGEKKVEERGERMGERGNRRERKISGLFLTILKPLLMAICITLSKLLKKKNATIKYKNQFQWQKKIHLIVCSIESGADISMKKSRMPTPGYLFLSFPVNIHFVFWQSSSKDTWQQALKVEE